CGEQGADDDGRRDRQPSITAAAECEVACQAGQDVDREIDGDIAKQKSGETRGPGVEKNPKGTVRERGRREMPGIEAAINNQRQDRDEKREQISILAAEA